MAVAHVGCRSLPRVNRRLTPYVLLGILTLGTGLAIGLGLSEGPVTYTASAEATTGNPCSAAPKGAEITCHLSSGAVVVWFGHGRRLSEGSINCIVDGVDGAKAAGHTEPTNLAAVEAAVKVLRPECERRDS